MFFCCICLWKTVCQHCFTSFVDTLLSAVLQPSFQVSNVRFCSMTFCYSRKLPSKVPSVRG